MQQRDGITIVRAANRRLCKVVHSDGTIDDYQGARLVDLIEREFEDFDGLARLLTQLASRRDAAVVRGAPADPTRTRGVRRLVHADPETGDPPTLVECSRSVVAFDFDTIARPDSVNVTDLEGCARAAIAHLPLAYHRAETIVQATSGHAIKPGIRLRLWYGLSRPTSGAELTSWLRRTPVDPSPFRPAQLIYTATPVFMPGALDPLPTRLVRLGGTPTVPVPPASELRPAPRPPAAAPPPPGSAGSGDYAATVLTRALVRIGRAGVGQRNPSLLAAACTLAPLIKHRLITETTVTEALIGAAKRAGLDDEPHRGAEREAKKAVAWALAHFEQQPTGDAA
jgi:hypothetical protein